MAYPLRGVRPLELALHSGKRVAIFSANVPRQGFATALARAIGPAQASYRSEVAHSAIHVHEHRSGCLVGKDAGRHGEDTNQVHGAGTMPPTKKDGCMHLRKNNVVWVFAICNGLIAMQQYKMHTTTWLRAMANVWLFCDVAKFHRAIGHHTG